MIDNQTYLTTLSPELLKCYMIQKIITNNSKVEKSEIFSIAVLVLSTIYGEEFQNYYDYASYKIDYKRLYKRLNRLIKLGFNEELCDLMVLMLNEAPNSRPTFEEVIEKLEEADLPVQKFSFQKED